mmetsp:Transcript_21658/g.66314  ORF Transcript_21658/g.66314 Transcript_21658/m.66314 type:complete len:101 (-) Transcript_21658:643-945(-)
MRVGLLALALACDLGVAMAWKAPAVPSLGAAGRPIRERRASRAPRYLSQMPEPPKGPVERVGEENREKGALEVDFELDGLTVGVLGFALIAFNFFVLANL